ncbi:MAG: tripartite tricarboxylate transporter permease [Pseudomonadota bacterium]
MSFADSLLLGLATAFEPHNVLYCLIGVTLGTFVGVIPGIGALAAISMLLPVTFYLDSTTSIVMLAGVYYGTVYGGSTAAILLNLPGVPSAAVACLDGYPMTKQGRGGIALFLTTIASFVGSMLGFVALVAFARSIAELGLLLGPADYVMMMALALTAAATISVGSQLKGFAMVILGLLLGTVGTDVHSGVSRFTFGHAALLDGISLVAIAMGLFGISEVVNASAVRTPKEPLPDVRWRSMIPSLAEFGSTIRPMLRGSAIGGFFGALPGVGGTIASFASYAVEKRISPHPERFGKGTVEGMAAAESANNSAIQTAFIPSLALGIPGDAVMALLLGALIIHGITPGPLLIEQQPVLFWGLVMSFVVGNILLVILNIPLIGIWLKLLSIPYHYLFPAVIVFVCFGALSVNLNPFDVYVVALVGAFGWFMSRLGFQPAPLMLGFILGPMLEENLRRTLVISRGDYTVFVERPVSLTLLIATLLLIFVPLFLALRRRPLGRAAPSSSANRP